MISDWWISIRFVCLCVSRFVACDRNYETAAKNAIRRFRKKPEVAWKRGLRALRPLRCLAIKTNGCRKKFQDLVSKY